MTVTRAVLILIILAGIALVFGSDIVLPQRERVSGPLCKGCNVILISIDTLGAKQVSVYNPLVDTTPFLEEISAKRGIVFERAYAQAPWTLPSHAAMLTGRYPWDLGVWEALDALPLSVDTVAERFAKEGYATALFSNGAFVQPQWNFDQGFEKVITAMEESAWNDLPQLFEKGTEWAISQKRDGRPFFLFLRPFEVHDPYGTPGTPGAFTIEDMVAMNKMPEGPDEISAAPLRTAHREEVKDTDDALRSLFSWLEQSGLMDNTVILITADHGEEFGEHGTVGHSVALYNESIHVPFLLYLPDTAPARVGASIEVRSVPATLLNVVGIRTYDPYIAKSVVPFIIGVEREPRMALFRTKFEREAYVAGIEAGYKALEEVLSGTQAPEVRTIPYQGPYSVGAVKGQWKVIKHIGKSNELYDLSSNPSETRNLFNDSSAVAPEYRGIVAELMLELAY